MKFYVETASGMEVNCVGSFKMEPAHFKQKPNPSAKEETVLAFTTEINSVEDLLSFVNETGGAVVIEWQAKYPPAAPRQHIPVLRLVDDYL